MVPTVPTALTATVPTATTDRRIGTREFYTSVVDAFEPSDAQWTDDERVDVLAHKWWTLAELIATKEPYEPAELVNLVRRQLPSC